MHLRLIAPLAVLAMGGVGATAFDSAPVGEVVARAAALGHLGVATLLAPTTTRRVRLELDHGPVDTYQVEVHAALPATAARVSVDDATGRVLAVQPL